MIRRLILKGILSVIFIAVLSAITLLFIADQQFNLAQKSEKKYLWQEAGRRYILAVRLDPFNAEYLAAYARFLYGLKSFQEAEALYTRAIQLNPWEAGYYAGLAEVQLAEGKSGIESLRKALQNDPNGFVTAYKFGYAGMGMWGKLNKEEQQFMLDRLKYALELRPRLSQSVYSRVLKATGELKYLQYITAENLKAQKRLYDFLIKNKLKEFAGEQKKAVDLYTQKEKPNG